MEDKIQLCTGTEWAKEPKLSERYCLHHCRVNTRVHVYQHLHFQKSEIVTESVKDSKASHEQNAIPEDPVGDIIKSLRQVKICPWHALQHGGTLNHS